MPQAILDITYKYQKDAVVVRITKQELTIPLVKQYYYVVKNIYKEEAIMELELSDKPFVLYRNARRDVLQIVYRRPDGDYSIIELGSSL